MFKQKQGLSLVYAIVLGLISLVIAALVVFPLNEAWVYMKAVGLGDYADASTLGFMDSIISLVPIAFVIAFVIGLFTTAQFQRNEV